MSNREQCEYKQNNANMDKIIFPDLSYKIIGASFKVFNKLGFGLQEKHYQRALAAEFKSLGINFEEQKPMTLKYEEETIGRYIVDFLIENKIILELKVVNKLGYVNAKQVLGYLKIHGIKLGILLYFTKDGIKYRRVLNSSV